MARAMVFAVRTDPYGRKFGLIRDPHGTGGRLFVYAAEIVNGGRLETGAEVEYDLGVNIRLKPIATNVRVVGYRPRTSRAVSLNKATEQRRQQK